MTDILSQDGVAVGDDWGDINTLAKIDTLSVQPIGNDILVRFSTDAGSGGYRWSQPSKLYAGGFNTFDQGVVAGYSHFQFKRAIAGAAATCNFKAFEK